MTPEQKCKETIPTAGGWYHARCSNKAVRDGFCNVHHPDTRAMRRAKSARRYQETLTREAQERNRRARETVDAFLSHVKGQVPRSLWSHLVHAMEKWDREETAPRDSETAAGGGGDTPQP